MPATEQSTLDYTIRAMTEADIAAVVNFYHELEALEPMGHDLTLEGFTARYHEPDNRYYTRLLAQLTNEDGSEGKLVGYGFILKHDDDDSAVMRLHVLPEYRNHGLGSSIYQRLEQQARDQGASKMISEPDERANLTPSFLAKRDFIRDHATWTMRLPADHAVPEAQMLDGYTFRNFQTGDEPILRQVATATFAGYKDYFPNDTEQAVEETREPDYDPRRLTFAFASDEVVGYCQAEVEANEGKSWIDNLGVVPAHRCAGLGRALLLAGIAYARQFVPIVLLGVEDYNDKAIRLYQSVGFEKLRGEVAMVKQLTENEVQ
jgi:mycothiol synthase